MGKGTVFAWQHDARHHGNGLVSVFDDGAAPQVEPQSRALLIRLDGKRGRATLVRQYTHRPGRLVSQFMGNAQVLGNGNVLVGWGNEPYVTEFGPGGAILFDAKLPDDGQNYRAFRFPWVGIPGTRPALVARHAKGARSLYVSWNGATEVAAWLIRTGDSPSSLDAGTRVPKRSFETAVTAPAGTRYARAVALDRHGKRLGSSKTIRV
jgi:hypothetical protein